jgi:hypothetical protein
MRFHPHSLNFREGTNTEFYFVLFRRAWAHTSAVAKISFKDFTSESVFFQNKLFASNVSYTLGVMEAVRLLLKNVSQSIGGSDTERFGKETIVAKITQIYPVSYPVVFLLWPF